ncbi:uncharacterized protein LOC131974937, partial [Centropristis striata]|uniref:uncharacterized protein LOC131974937 n=1 Tax=Centropristis striata TaxID=184440 RepID=UPI0027DF850E
RTGGGCEENRDPGEDLQNLKRWGPQSRSRTRTVIGIGSESGLRCGDQVQFCRPEVRLALIRKTKLQTDPGSAETQKDRRSSVTWTRTTGSSPSEVRSRSTGGPLRTTVSDQSSGARISRRKVLGPESSRADGAPARTRTGSETCTRTDSETRTRTGSETRARTGSETRTRTGSETRARTGSETRTRRRRRIHPSVFRGRGLLRLSITPGAGQLIIHIHEARGLRSCDSYVKVVTSDLSIRMKTPPVFNNKNPEYNQEFILCVSDDVSRLMVSVFSRCRQLIGCMSFGIRSLVSSSEVVSGWFYLLGEEFGRSKHLRVTSQQNKPMRSSEEVLTYCADLRRTPDSAPDPDLNTTNLNLCSGGGLKDVTNHSRTESHPVSLNPVSSSSICGSASKPNANANQVQASRDSNQRQASRDSSQRQASRDSNQRQASRDSNQRLTVSPPTHDSNDRHRLKVQVQRPVLTHSLQRKDSMT